MIAISSQPSALSMRPKADSWKLIAERWCRFPSTGIRQSRSLFTAVDQDLLPRSRGIVLGARWRVFSPRIRENFLACRLGIFLKGIFRFMIHLPSGLDDGAVGR